MISQIPSLRQDIFLVAKIERLLSDCPADIYIKSSGILDAKIATKWAKSINTASQKLSQYRCLFAWAFRFNLNFLNLFLCTEKKNIYFE